MSHETFLKLMQGTEDDLLIACNWLVHHHDPILYITEHSNSERRSPLGTLPIKFDENIADDEVFETGTGRLYYKYDVKKYILVSDYGITVTDKNYNFSKKVINH